MKLIILIMLLLVASCSSLKAAEWSPWIDQDIEMSERRWDICHEEKYGPGLHMKGFCWSLNECRTRKRFLAKPLKECRVKIVFCKFGDIPCMVKYNLDNAELIIK